MKSIFTEYKVTFINFAYIALLSGILLALQATGFGTSIVFWLMAALTSWCALRLWVTNIALKTPDVTSDFYKSICKSALPMTECFSSFNVLIADLVSDVIGFVILLFIDVDIALLFFVQNGVVWLVYNSSCALLRRDRELLGGNNE